jgi:hypothetical protein
LCARFIFRLTFTESGLNMTDPRTALGALSFIVAPAVLTNASSILVLSTSNRLARAVDRMRVVSATAPLPFA